MKQKDSEYSFLERAAEKTASRASDEEKLQSGETSPAEMSRKNGGSLRGARYKGPSKRIQALASSKPPKNFTSS